VSTVQEITQYIVSEYLPGTRTDELDPSYDLFDNGVVTSLELLRVIDWVRDRYEISLDDLDVSPDNFRTVSAINGFITQVELSRVG
jgi:acyl carrier protein